MSISQAPPRWTPTSRRAIRRTTPAIATQAPRGTTTGPGQPGSLGGLQGDHLSGLMTGLGEALTCTAHG